MQASGSPRSGFTFVEVLATIVLIGIVVPVAMNGIGMAVRLASHTRRQMEATSLCRTRLTEFIALGEWETGGGRGDFGPDYPAYRWEAEVSTWTDAALRQVDVHVIWEASGKERSVTLSTLVYPEEQ